MYIGGAEHSVLHLLYSRLVTMALHDLGHLSFEEPFERFRAHGLLAMHGTKMSKSRGNVVNPDAYIARLGADTLRMYLVFLGPYEHGGEFSDRGIAGMRRFLGRVWDLVLRHADNLDAEAPPLDARRALHSTVRQVTDLVQSLRYNTAVAALMTYTNSLNARPRLHAEEVSSFLRLLAPFAPHLAEELWARLGNAYSIHQQPFPVADPVLLTRATDSVVVQINGRTRGVVQLPVGLTQEEVLEAAGRLSAVKPVLDHADIRRVIYVPGRILNLVLA